MIDPPSLRAERDGHHEVRDGRRPIRSMIHPVYAPYRVDSR
jgi:hypothetical protein